MKEIILYTLIIIGTPLVLGAVGLMIGNALIALGLWKVD